MIFLCRLSLETIFSCVSPCDLAEYIILPNSLPELVFNSVEVCTSQPLKSFENKPFVKLSKSLLFESGGWMTVLICIYEKLLKEQYLHLIFTNFYGTICILYKFSKSRLFESAYFLLESLYSRNLR